MTCGVYLLTHRETGKTYVGSSVDIEKRLKHHRKYSFPENMFCADVLEECKETHLSSRENHWMFELESLNPKKGYNRAHSVRAPRKELSWAQMKDRFNKNKAKHNYS